MSDRRSNFGFSRVKKIKHSRATVHFFEEESIQKNKFKPAFIIFMSLRNVEKINFTMMLYLFTSLFVTKMFIMLGIMHIVAPRLKQKYFAFLYILFIRHFYSFLNLYVDYRTQKEVFICVLESPPIQTSNCPDSVFFFISLL